MPIQTLTLECGVTSTEPSPSIQPQHPLNLNSPSTSATLIMPSLFTIPNEIFEGIIFYLDPLATSHLLITCRALSSRLAPVMVQLAVIRRAELYALHRAADRKYLRLLQSILPLFPADSHGDPALFHGADIHGCGEDGTIPLMIAVQYGDLEIVKMLVAKAANLRRVNPEGCTPLIQAICYGHEELAVYLAGLHGVDISSANNVGDAPLHLAAAAGWESVVRILVNQGCPVDSVDRKGFTALQIAVAKGWNTIVEILLEKGAERDIVRN